MVDRGVARDEAGQNCRRLLQILVDTKRSLSEADGIVRAAIRPIQDECGDHVQFQSGAHTFRFSDGDTYDGAWEDKHFDGHGCLQCKTFTYTGEWRSGSFHGQGTMTRYGVANRVMNIYNGSWVSGSQHGIGTFRADGHEFQGEWRAGTMNGKGVFTFESGDSYEGSFKAGAPDGQGVLNCLNGDHYQGEFAMGEFHGEGTLTLRDGTTYTGEWSCNVEHGNGTLSGPDFQFEGEWRCGSMQGRGKYIHPNGDLYDGEWLNNLEHGFGVYTFYDGSQYEGEWEHGEMQGQGLYIYGGGEQYEGEWDHNMRNGKGTFNYKSGAVYVGAWEEDVPNGDGIYSTKTGKQYAVSYQQGQCTSKTVISAGEALSRKQSIVEESLSRRASMHMESWRRLSRSNFEASFRAPPLSQTPATRYNQNAYYAGLQSPPPPSSRDSTSVGGRSQGSGGKSRFEEAAAVLSDDGDKNDAFKGIRTVNSFKQDSPSGSPTPLYLGSNSEAISGILVSNNNNANLLAKADRRMSVTFGPIENEYTFGDSLTSAQVVTEDTGNSSSDSGNDRYIGDHQGKKKHGYGTFRYSNGASYSGEWKNDRPDGTGVYTYSTGKRFSVTYKRGRLESKTPLPLLHQQQQQDGNNLTLSSPLKRSGSISDVVPVPPKEPRNNSGRPHTVGHFPHDTQYLGGPSGSTVSSTSSGATPGHPDSDNEMVIQATLSTANLGKHCPPRYHHSQLRKKRRRRRSSSNSALHLASDDDGTDSSSDKGNTTGGGMPGWTYPKKEEHVDPQVQQQQQQAGSPTGTPPGARRLTLPIGQKDSFRGSDSFRRKAHSPPKYENDGAISDESQLSPTARSSRKRWKSSTTVAGSVTDSGRRKWSNGQVTKQFTVHKAEEIIHSPGTSSNSKGQYNHTAVGGHMYYSNPNVASQREPHSNSSATEDEKQVHLPPISGSSSPTFPLHPNGAPPHNTTTTQQHHQPTHIRVIHVESNGSPPPLPPSPSASCSSVNIGISSSPEMFNPEYAFPPVSSHVAAAAATGGDTIRASPPPQSFSSSSSLHHLPPHHTPPLMDPRPQQQFLSPKAGERHSSSSSNNRIPRRKSTFVIEEG